MAIFHEALPGEQARRVARPRAGSGAGPQRDVAGGDGRQTARTMMWSLEAGGWTKHEAGNLVGLASGLRPAASGWNEREIEHLRFLRALVETGRLDH
jgi:hypothetical protein